MLVPLKEKDFNRYINFAYDLSLDPARSGYPAYFDGIKTKEDFIERAREAFSRPGDEILIYYVDGGAVGWIHYGCLGDDRHLFLYACCVRQNAAKALTELSEYLSARYPRCKWIMCFSTENKESVAWMEEAGFARLEDSCQYVLSFDHYVPGVEDPGVERITKVNFEKFRRVHEKVDRDMYWNTLRVRRDLDKWDLFVAEDDGVAGEVMALRADDFYEIYALVSEDGQFHEGLYLRLLRRILNEGKRKGAKNLTFFVKTGSGEERVLPEVGFERVGRYIAYRKEI